MIDLLHLLPCPFCGGEAEMGVNKESTVREYFVGCMNCHIRLYKIGYKRFYTEAEAIEAWNTRAERTCKVIDFIEHVIMDEPDIAELSCGHDCMVFGKENVPSYCPYCGARVVE